MKLLTIVESPFATDRTMTYLRRCLKDSWARNELPFASHAFFPLFLDEDKPEERELGIVGGYHFWDFARQIAFYIDYGMTPGMTAAEEHARDLELVKTGDIKLIYRSIGK